ncbi:MAG: peptide transporter, partial [Verrucomicrobiales bacterium]|nr:peptide transporter [Verrucomicrobiales bacterium]
MPAESHDVKPKSFLPRIGSAGYYILLGAVAIFILGPLGGISAAYMNFSLGFFVGGQVLAGILGSVVTYGYGSEGKHGANYIQTMAASVAGMAGMAVLVQAMVWLGLPQPPMWKLILYFCCIGMLGVGVGMFYTPILVDRMQLPYPSGFAVANILRALTDKALLRQSVLKLGGGTGGGMLGGLIPFWFGKVSVPQLQSFAGWLDESGFSASNVGAGMIVGARITVPAVVVAFIGYELTPWLRSIGWLGPNDPFRRIGFLVALGTILGAALVDLSMIGYQAVKRWREKVAAPPTEDWKKVNQWLLLSWVVFWAAATAFVASYLLGQPIGFVLFAIALVFLFVMINGISQGISDSNPISSAFVISVVLMGMLGLKDAGTGLMCASILLISCGTGCDMQQDRSTGWRLGTNRVIQFRFQVIGIVMGAVLSVVLARLFMQSYPVLQINSFDHPHPAGGEKWQSAMTYKFVGALQGLQNAKPFVMKALLIGIGAGLVIEILR